MLFNVKPEIVVPSKVSVETAGEHVLLHIGNSTLKLGYEEAITLSQWLRVRGKEAKKVAGDVSRHWHAVAIIGGAPEE